MAAPSVVQFSSYASSATVTTITITEPTTSTISADNLLVVIVGNSDNTGTATFPSVTGWTLHSQGGNSTNDSKLAVYYRVATGGGTDGDFSVPVSTASDHAFGWYIEVQDVDVTDPFNVFNTYTISAGTTTTVDAVTTTNDQTLAFAAWSFDGADSSFSVNTANGWPSSIPTNQDLYSAGNAAGASGGWLTKTITTAGSTNDLIIGNNVNDGWVSVQFALNPVSTRITSVDSGYGLASRRFDVNEDSLDINGLVFGATQGSGTVYLAEAFDLNTSVAEVDIGAAIQSWSNTQINLDLTTLTTELTSIENLIVNYGHTLYVIVTTNTSDEASRSVSVSREKVFSLYSSSFIASSGENTTAQLSAPSGKTTGDFGGGRIQDDENPGDAVSILADEYREDEWSIIATSNAVSGKIYQFRVVADSKTLNTYTVDPQWTIATPVAVIGYSFGFILD